MSQSGDEAIALHLPLFAAVAAHYATDLGAPRFILPDEVVVGVDSNNRGQIFALLVELGLDLGERRVVVREIDDAADTPPCRMVRLALDEDLVAERSRRAAAA